MPSMTLLRILLLAAATSGSLVIACSDTTSPSGNRGDDDSDDDNADDDDETPPKRDAGKNDAGKKDAGRRADAGRDSGGGSSCMPGACECDDGATGFRTCLGGNDECACMEVTGEMGPPIETCPGDLTCGRVFNMGPFCLGAAMPPIPTAAPPTCPESKDCSELDLPGAQCVSYGGFVSFCAQPCVLEGGTTGDAGTDDEEPGEPDDEETVDAGRDASSGASDARVDSGRDR